jgi:hypothetical protein
VVNILEKIAKDELQKHIVYLRGLKTKGILITIFQEAIPRCGMVRTSYVLTGLWFTNQSVEINLVKTIR